MKKWLLLLLLICCFLCVGWEIAPTNLAHSRKKVNILDKMVKLAWLQVVPVNEPIVSSGTSDTACSSCSTCTGCSDADFLCEDWDEDNSCSWTITCNSCSETATHSGTFNCTDKGDYCLQMDFDGDYTDKYYSYNLGAAESGAIYESLYINVVSEAIEDGEEFILLSMETAAGDNSPACKVNLSQSGGSLYFKFCFRTGGSYSCTNSGAISTNTWYRLRIYYNKTDDDVAFYVDDTQIVNNTSASLERTPQYIELGGTHYVLPTSSADEIDVQYDNIKVDSDAFPSACPTS